MSARPILAPLGRFVAVLLLVVVTRTARAEVPTGAAAPEAGTVAPLVELAPPVAAPAPNAPVPRTSLSSAPPPPALGSVPGQDERPRGLRLARRWWFWTGLGAAAVGAVLAGIFLAPRQPYTGTAGLQQVF